MVHICLLEEVVYFNFAYEFLCNHKRTLRVPVTTCVSLHHTLRVIYSMVNMTLQPPILRLHRQMFEAFFVDQLRNDHTGKVQDSRASRMYSALLRPVHFPQHVRKSGILVAHSATNAALHCRSLPFNGTPDLSEEMLYYNTAVTKCHGLFQSSLRVCSNAAQNLLQLKRCHPKPGHSITYSAFGILFLADSRTSYGLTLSLIYQDFRRLKIADELDTSRLTYACHAVLFAAMQSKRCQGIVHRTHNTTLFSLMVLRIE